MRKPISLLSIIFFCFVFVSCASQDNEEHTKETEITKMVAPSQAWDGYEDLQGKSFGNVLTMPDKIEPAVVSEVYCILPELRENRNDETDSKEYFKRFFGEKYNEKNITNPEKGRFVYSEGLNDYDLAVYVNGSPDNSRKNGSLPLGSNDYQLDKRYYPGTDDNVTIEVGTENRTVGDLFDAAVKYSSYLLEGHFNDLEIFPESLYTCYNADLDEYAAGVTMGFKYKGVEIESQFTPLFEVQDRGFYEVITSYNPMSFSIDLYGIDDVRFVNYTCGDWKFTAEKQEQIMSLAAAVDTLEKELAPNSSYLFEKVGLIYCLKTTGPARTNDSKANESINADYGEVKPARYEPTWCFTYTVNTLNGMENNYVKVNAVTGEITIDK